MLLLLCFIAGAALAVQAVVNADLASALASPLLATLVSLLGSLVLVSVALPLVHKTSSFGFSQLAQVPWYLLLGGIGGAVFLLATVVSTPRIGAVAVFCLVVAGQVITSLLLELHRNGLWQSISLLKLTGALCVIVGAVLVNWEKIYAN